MEEALSRVVPDSNCHVILSIRHGLVWTKPDMMKIATRFFGADQVRFGLITLVGPTHDAVAEATAGQLDVVYRFSGHFWRPWKTAISSNRPRRTLYGMT